MAANTRIIFFGTPEFAVHCLEALVRAQQNIVAVVTAPDRKAGRGKKWRSSAVCLAAKAHGLPVLQPENLKAPEFLAALRAYDPTLMVVVAFRMLPKQVWSIPKKGCFNLHASLLPHYRGAAPINWAIINGETETGLTTFLIDEKIDTGQILNQSISSIFIRHRVINFKDKTFRARKLRHVQILRRIVNVINIELSRWRIILKRRRFRAFHG